jgi:hypothetical protein
VLIQEDIILKLEGRVIGDGNGDSNGKGISRGDAAGHGRSGEGINGGDAAIARYSWSGEKGFRSSVKVEEGYKKGCKKGEGGKEGCSKEKGFGSSIRETYFFLFPFFFSAAIARVFRAICS